MNKKHLIEKYTERFRVDNSSVGYLNLMNGSVFIDDKYLSRSLKEFYKKADNSEKKELNKMGFLIPKEEESLVREYIKILKKEKENLIPECIIFILGFECNFNCPYCTPQNYKIKYGQKSIAKTEEINLKKVFEMIRKNKFLLKGAKNQINFYGGEPFLNFSKRKKQMKDIFLELTKIKPRLVLIPTNGFEIDKFQDEFKLLTSKKISLTLQITLDGPEKIHNLTRKTHKGEGTFKKIVDNINLLMKNNPNIKFKIRTNISYFNKKYLYDYIKYLKNNQKNWINNKKIEFYFIPIFDSSFSNMNQKNITDVELYKFFIYLHKEGIKNVRSHAIFDFLINSLNGKSELRSTIRCKDIVFGPDGKIYDCDLCDPQTKVGEVSTKEIDKSKLKYHWKGQKYNIEKCKNCKYLFLCDGGDRLASLKKTGSPCSPMCDCYRKNFSLFYKLLLNPEKRYKENEEIIKIECLKK